MKQLDDYLKLQKDIYDYFGYNEDWRVIPIDDARSYYWKATDTSVKFAESIEQFNSDGDYYQNEIYKQRFLPKWIYRGNEYTMICVDTHTDGNQFLQIFDNSKEIS